MRCHVLCAFVLSCLLTSAGRNAAGDEKVSFNRDIRPLLSAKCFQCHGPDDKARQAELRFDVSDGDSGPFAERDGTRAIVPGDVDASAIWQRVTSVDPDEMMPPQSAHKKPLTGAQKDLFRRWILQGAPYEDFWAFVPPREQTVPEVSDAQWNAQPIDRFVMARLEKEGRRPQPRADERTLIRRASFDLTGLPPTPDEIGDFLNDTSPDAWEKVVDRLIASPQFGEHMARYWLDLVRFADTNGIHHDHYREVTPYRDWVIRSFNENLPYDDFVIHQIAGDLYDGPTIDQQIASGFNRLHLVIDVGTALPEESFNRNVVDRVTAVGTAFMGLTVGCAVCHDHKYDPLTQKEFYQLYAFFNNDQATPETPSVNTDDHKLARHAPFLQMATTEQTERLRSIDGELAALTARIDELKATTAAVDQATTATGGSSRQTSAAELKQKEDELAALKLSKLEFEKSIPVTLVMKEREDIKPAYILIRGAYDKPGEQVERGTPAFLPPMPQTDHAPNRMDLARWLTDESHPLTGRVAVNRFWQQFFGIGLVHTSEDFGVQGEVPSHPELLDDLTIRFLRSGWDVKALVKSFVMSETWQQSSSAPPEAFQLDPDNRLLARAHRGRLDAEMIRDQILSVSGLLNQSLFGRSVKPPQPADLWKSVSMPSSSTFSFQADTGEKIYRRSLYTFWKRAMPPPQMTIFDAPTRESCIARRERTNTPLQALVLMNEAEYFKAAGHFARRILMQPDLTERQRLSFAWESVTSRVPDERELTLLADGLNNLRATFADDVASARTIAEQSSAEQASPSDAAAQTNDDCVEVAAYTMLVNSLFSLDITRTRD